MAFTISLVVENAVMSVIVLFLICILLYLIKTLLFVRIRFGEKQRKQTGITSGKADADEIRFSFLLVVEEGSAQQEEGLQINLYHKDRDLEPSRV
jgi:hypothetical protein